MNTGHSIGSCLVLTCIIVYHKYLPHLTSVLSMPRGIISILLIAIIYENIILISNF